MTSREPPLLLPSQRSAGNKQRVVVKKCLPCLLRDAIMSSDRFVPKRASGSRHELNHTNGVLSDKLGHWMNVILRGIVLSALLASPVYAEQPWEKFREYPGPYHLGDEHIGSWSPLIGPCMSIEFPPVRTGGRIGVTYEPYGLENVYIEFSSGDRFVLPPQRVLSGRRPNYWGEPTNQTFSATQFLNGVTARICAAFLEPGDLDDFMLRNVATWGQQPALRRLFRKQEAQATKQDWKYRARQRVKLSEYSQIPSGLCRLGCLAL